MVDWAKSTHKTTYRRNLPIFHIKCITNVIQMYYNRGTNVIQILTRKFDVFLKGLGMLSNNNTEKKMVCYIQFIDFLRKRGVRIEKYREKMYYKSFYIHPYPHFSPHFRGGYPE